jgi:hypothetical protein
MKPRDQERAAALKWLSGWCDVQQVMRERHLSARELADDVLEFQAHARTYLLGGAAEFTGNNRVFGNGAVAYQVRCRKCRHLFWVTTVPHALCPDCQ